MTVTANHKHYFLHDFFYHYRHFYRSEFHCHCHHKPVLWWQCLNSHNLHSLRSKKKFNFKSYIFFSKIWICNQKRGFLLNISKLSPGLPRRLNLTLSNSFLKSIWFMFFLFPSNVYLSRYQNIPEFSFRLLYYKFIYSPTYTF